MKHKAPLAIVIYLMFQVSIASFAQTQKDKVKVAFLLYPEIAILDYTGPLDVFVKANRMTNNQYELFTISETTNPIQTQGHVLTTQAEYTFSNAPQADILIVPGAKIDVVESIGKNAAYAAFIKKYNAAAQVTMSVCTGYLSWESWGY